MPIWVDADACPVPIREILCRAATRWQIQTTFIANHAISLPPSPHISRRQVPHGFDVADNEIMDQMSKGDLVITQDIPLAAEAIEKGADVFNPRGQAFTKENIRQRLAMRLNTVIPLILAMRLASVSPTAARAAGPSTSSSFSIARTPGIKLGS